MSSDELSFAGDSSPFAPDFMDGFSLLRACGVFFTLIMPATGLIVTTVRPLTTALIYQFMMSLVLAATVVAEGFSNLALGMLEIIW